FFDLFVHAILRILAFAVLHVVSAKPASPEYGSYQVVHRWQRQFPGGSCRESKPSQLHNAVLGAGFRLLPASVHVWTATIPFPEHLEMGREPARSIARPDLPAGPGCVAVSACQSTDFW